jgi:hypothetical protein
MSSSPEPTHLSWVLIIFLESILDITTVPQSFSIHGLWNYKKSVKTYGNFSINIIKADPQLYDNMMNYWPPRASLRMINISYATPSSSIACSLKVSLSFREQMKLSAAAYLLPGVIGYYLNFTLV